jgi:hypothetical protein
VDEPDRDRVQEVQLLAAPRLVTTRPASSSCFRCFITPKRRHLEALLERAQRLAVLAEELVEQAPPGRVGQGLEHLVHGRRYVTIWSHVKVDDREPDRLEFAMARPISE